MDQNVFQSMKQQWLDNTKEVTPELVAKVKSGDESAKERLRTIGSSIFAFKHYCDKHGCNINGMTA